MSRNQQKITKALNIKGYYPIEIIWEPIGGAPEMCGPEGGWYIKVGVMPPNNETKDDFDDYYDVILGYNINDVLDDIDRLPTQTPKEEGKNDDK